MAISWQDPQRPPLARLRSDWKRTRGARLRAEAPRYLATTALALLVALGVRALLWPPQPQGPVSPSLSADRPSEDLALQFARAYLTFDSARPAAREHALSPFLPTTLDSGAGFFAGSGSQSVRWAQVASDQPALGGGRVITVAAGVSGRRLPVYLAVSVRHRVGRGVGLVGYPSFVGPPLVDSGAAEETGAPVDDPALSAVIARVLRNYLSGSAPNLRADLAPEAVVTLPTVELAVQRIASLVWIAGPGSRAVLATVLAADRRGATYTLTYEFGLAYRERPYVDFIEVIPTAR